MEQMSIFSFRYDRAYSSAPELRAHPDVAAALMSLAGGVEQEGDGVDDVGAYNGGGGGGVMVYPAGLLKRGRFQVEEGPRKSQRVPKLSRKVILGSGMPSLMGRAHHHDATMMMMAGGQHQDAMDTSSSRSSGVGSAMPKKRPPPCPAEVHVCLHAWLKLKLGDIAADMPQMDESAPVAELRAATAKMIVDWKQYIAHIQ